MQECELLNAVSRAAQMGCVGICAVLDRAEDGDFRAALLSQLTEYRAIQAEAKRCLDQHGGAARPLPAMARRGAYMMGRMQTARDSSCSHIAGMMIQGNTKGMVKSLQNLRRYHGRDLQTWTLARRLLDTELANIEQMKPYL